MYRLLPFVIVLAVTFSAVADTHYVNVSNTTPAAPYITWATAATNIQDAVDIASPSDIVLVTNGVYDTGFEFTPNYSSRNRVVITKDITVQSVNGPETTFIVGAEASGGGNGPGALRGVFMSAGILSGFTVTNGHTYTSGDSVDRYGGGIYAYFTNSCLVSNCIISGNSAAGEGGGMARGILNNCTLSGNSAALYAGGCYQSTLNNCTLYDNTAPRGGGGTVGGVLNNCTLYNNSATNGGGCYMGTLYNCTLTGNSAVGNGHGGGCYFATLHNCILWGNTTAGPPSDNWYVTSQEITYTCTIPLPAGTGNITNDPQFVDAAGGNYRLQSTSPCFNAGLNDDAPGDTDLDGNPRMVAGMVDLGAYEIQTIPVHDGDSSTHYVAQNNTNALWPYTNWLTAAATIQDAVDTAASNDTVWVSNGIYNTGTRVTPGYISSNRVVITNNITVESVNGPSNTFIVGSEATGGGSGVDAVRGVYMSAGLLSGFTVTNGHTRSDGHGVFDRFGGGIFNLNGGSGVVSNCILSGNSASIAGGGSCYGTQNNCILTGNSATSLGGGSFESALNNCTLTGNSADIGGGSYGSTLNNCLLTGNSAGDRGGGSYGSTLNNCTIIFNSAGFRGGGVSLYSTLNNCIIWSNTAPSGGANWQLLTPDTSISNSCTTPDPGGTGNITNDPQFVDADNGNYRLQAGSPCIDTGMTVAGITNDLDGIPRPLDGNNSGTAAPDMGAYEFISDSADTDGDSATDWAEWIAGTDMTDTLSVLHAVVDPTVDGPFLSWPGMTGRTYSVFYATNMLPGEFQPLAGYSNIPCITSGPMSLTVSNLPVGFHYFGIQARK